MRESFQSYLDKETLKPIWFERKSHEGGYEAHEVYSYDHKEKRVYSATGNSNRSFKQDTLILPHCGFDVLTMIYYARNLDFSSVKINETLPVTVVIDNAFYNLYIRYLGKEVIETKNKEKYRCIKFSALLVDGTIFKGGEDLFVWVTDDKNRIPVFVQAKILIGSVKAYLNNAEGIRNKPDSRIFDK